jgi:beta-phosphoglucomutase-like phosphatase (HAD superfamily)
VLQAAGHQNFFEVRVDGNVAAAKKLAGKPSSDTYEEATRMLGTLPEQAVVIEDAISGVQAGRTGGFGLVIGVARSDDRRFFAKTAPTSLCATLQNLD